MACGIDRNAGCACGCKEGFFVDSLGNPKPREHRDAAVPLGARIAARGALPQTASSMSAQAHVPIGARPSVPLRVDFARPNWEVFQNSGWEFDPFAPPASRRSLLVTSRGIVPAPEPGSEAGMQFVPPPPASQEVCIVNGFDAAWGEPPASYDQIPLEFDPYMGAYRLDLMRVHEILGPELENPERLQRLDLLTKQYRAGFMLQPFKRERSDPWSFRWIPQVRRAACTPLAPPAPPLRTRFPQYRVPSKGD